MKPCLLEPEFWEPVRFEIVDTMIHVTWRLAHNICGYDSPAEQFMFNMFLRHKR